MFKKTITKLMTIVLCSVFLAAPVSAHGPLGVGTAKEVSDLLGKTYREAQKTLPEIAENSFSNQIMIYGDQEEELSLVAQYDVLAGGALDNTIIGIQTTELYVNFEPSYKIYGAVCGMIDSDVNYELWNAGFKSLYTENESDGWCETLIDDLGHMVFAHYTQYGYLRSLYLRWATQEEISKYL